jgi:hypothetical protein
MESYRLEWLFRISQGHQVKQRSLTKKWEFCDAGQSLSREICKNTNEKLFFVLTITSEPNATEIPHYVR